MVGQQDHRARAGFPGAPRQRARAARPAAQQRLPREPVQPRHASDEPLPAGQLVRVALQEVVQHREPAQRLGPVVLARARVVAEDALRHARLVERRKRRHPVARLHGGHARVVRGIVVPGALVHVLAGEQVEDAQACRSSSPPTERIAAAARSMTHASCALASRHAERGVLRVKLVDAQVAERFARVQRVGARLAVRVEPRVEAEGAKGPGAEAVLLEQVEEGARRWRTLDHGVRHEASVIELSGASMSTSCSAEGRARVRRVRARVHAARSARQARERRRGARRPPPRSTQGNPPCRLITTSRRVSEAESAARSRSDPLMRAQRCSRPPKGFSDFAPDTNSNGSRARAAAQPAPRRASARHATNATPGPAARAAIRGGAARTRATGRG